MSTTNSSKVSKTVLNSEGKRVARPIQESKRKRPSKSVIEAQADIRGFMTGNEKTSLATLKVKNAWQRINNRSMSDDVTVNFTSTENEELQRLINAFVKGVDAVLKNK